MRDYFNEGRFFSAMVYYLLLSITGFHSISSRSDGYLSVWKEFVFVSWPSRKRAKNGRLDSELSRLDDSVLSRIE